MQVIVHTIAKDGGTGESHVIGALNPCLRNANNCGSGKIKSARNCGIDMREFEHKCSQNYNCRSKVVITPEKGLTLYCAIDHV